MSYHPYRAQPDRSFWSRAVGRGFAAESLVAPDEPLIRSNDLVVSAGSCFAGTLVPYIEQAGLTYLRTETPHPVLATMPENLGYRSFSAAYGNIYTTRQLRQLVERALGRLRPIEDRWHIGGNVIDPFRPGLRYPATSDAEFDALRAQHFACVRAAFTKGTVVIVTMGLTEAWASAHDGAVYPACPGTIAGTFDPAQHVFHNFSVEEMREDLVAFIDTVRELNPDARFILTVSPVPMIATATGNHVVVANTYSKSSLRVALGDVASKVPGVTYFPAYEIVTGSQAPADYYGPGARDVSEGGKQAVMDALLAHCEVTNVRRLAASSAPAGPQHAKLPPGNETPAFVLSKAVADAECDEAMAEAEPFQQLTASA